MLLFFQSQIGKKLSPNIILIYSYIWASIDQPLRCSFSTSWKITYWCSGKIFVNKRLCGTMLWCFMSLKLTWRPCTFILQRHQKYCSRFKWTLLTPKYQGFPVSTFLQTKKFRVWDGEYKIRYLLVQSIQKQHTQ